MCRRLRTAPELRKEAPLGVRRVCANGYTSERHKEGVSDSDEKRDEKGTRLP